MDLYSPESTYGRSVWGVSGPGGKETHTLRIECTGTRNKPSRGTRIAVDAFDIDGARRGRVVPCVRRWTSRVYVCILARLTEYAKRDPFPVRVDVVPT